MNDQTQQDSATPTSAASELTDVLCLKDENERLKRAIHYALGYIESDGEAECMRALQRTGIPGHSIFAECKHCAGDTAPGVEYDDLTSRTKEMKYLRDEVRGLQPALHLEQEVIELRTRLAYVTEELRRLVQSCDGIDMVQKPTVENFDRAWRALLKLGGA